MTVSIMTVCRTRVRIMTARVVTPQNYCKNNDVDYNDTMTEKIMTINKKTAL
jgi:hypothetical protein